MDYINGSNSMTRSISSWAIWLDDTTTMMDRKMSTWRALEGRLNQPSLKINGKTSCGKSIRHVILNGNKILEHEFGVQNKVAVLIATGSVCLGNISKWAEPTSDARVCPKIELVILV